MTGRQGVDYIERKHGVQMLGEAPWIVVIGLGSEPIAGTGETNGSRATAMEGMSGPLDVDREAAGGRIGWSAHPSRGAGAAPGVPGPSGRPGVSRQRSTARAFRSTQRVCRAPVRVIFDRTRAALAWTERIPVSAHALRHTAITPVVRVARYPVAQAFAGDAPPSVTGTYMRIGIGEIAAAVVVLTDEPSPSADPW